VTLSNEVECDEAYVRAGHKGHPEVVKNNGRPGRRRQLHGPCGRGTLAKERPPVFGMMQRGGQVVLNLIANVQQKTIEPLIKATIVAGTLVYTDKYRIYARLQSWGYNHKHVNHGRGEFARDEDGDGFCEVHVNTMEGFVRSVDRKRSHLLGQIARYQSCNSVSMRVEAPPSKCRSDSVSPRSATGSQGSEAGINGGTW